MSDHISPTDTFEEVLDSGRSELSAARSEYDALEQTEEVPSALVEAISDLERELEELDQTLNVGDEDLKLARETVQRVGVLTDVFGALRERQRTIVEADVSRIEHYVSGIVTLARDHGVATHTPHDLEALERQNSMLAALVNKGRHEKVLTNDRVTPGEVDAAIRQVNAELTTEVSDGHRAETYESITEALLDEIHEMLSSLEQKNPDRTAYSSDLGSVKSLLESIDDTDDTSAAQIAHTALEGALMLHYAVARTLANQRVAVALADTVTDSELSVDCNVDQCVADGDAETLIGAITDAVDTEVELSMSERLRQLLNEHDGSVLRTAQATDFDVATILDHLEQLYNDGQISDLEVTFDQ
ncbi:hypothetical protein [Haloarcula sp. 1CSR25-25]|uniref:hypothetical protein n=1 Tax=Haloarcula sp. 1CSR25-25 TaxID=2862545 RepID=UPI0028940302|nr:hypothetical protein [Haloarcula sp. 1CSR25-25]MDT3433258.1 hypothetical protein [Haloarcula sp. 1CSR25-25]